LSNELTFQNDFCLAVFSSQQFCVRNSPVRLCVCAFVRACVRACVREKKKAASTTNLAMGARHQFVLENLQKKQIARSKTNLAVRAEHQSILEVLKQKKKVSKTDLAVGPRHQLILVLHVAQFDPLLARSLY